MKTNLLALTLLAFMSTAEAVEQLYVEDGAYHDLAGYKPETQSGTDKDMKIAYLNKLLDQQQRLYDEKITYLEDELKKSKDRLVEKSINHDKMQDYMQTRFAEESSFLKKELVAKTKTVMEYQRQLEKVKPSDDMKNYIKINTELALELRKSADQLAIIKLQNSEVQPQIQATGGRMPASVGK